MALEFARIKLPHVSTAIRKIQTSFTDEISFFEGAGQNASVGKVHFSLTINFIVLEITHITGTVLKKHFPFTMPAAFAEHPDEGSC